MWTSTSEPIVSNRWRPVMPAILCESTFLILPEEEDWLAHGRGVEEIAEAIAEGMEQFMKDAPIPGYTFDDSVPLSQDELDAVVRWKNGAELGAWAGKPVRLQFRMRSMRIYAFQFVG